MQNLDYRVIQQAIDWLEQGQTIWLCTVLSTFGSSPREPGAMMVAKADGAHVGSLSGGCVEEDFLDRLVQGEEPLPEPPPIEARRPRRAARAAPARAAAREERLLVLATVWSERGARENM